MAINQTMTRNKRILLLLGVVSLVLSVVCWVFLLNAGPSVSNGRITFGEYIRRWWLFSVLAILFFPLSVFSFIRCFSSKMKRIKTGVALILIAISIGLIILTGILISSKIIDYYVPNRINGNLALLYVAVLIVCGFISGFCMASQTKNVISAEHSKENDILSTKDNDQLSAQSKNEKYSYLEEYKAKMKEGQQ